MILKKFLKERRELVNIALDRYLPSKNEYPKEINKAIRYAVLSSGKRLRPILATMAYNLFGKTDDKIMMPACAIEFIHNYSLVHDDLPAIDNDDYRRGKQTTHKMFGPAIATLAGDALLSMAFGLVAQTEAEPELVVEIMKIVTDAANTSGMLGGQVLDILAEGKEISQEQSLEIHNKKTMKLIVAPLKIGAMMAGAEDKHQKRVCVYGEKIGLAFQIVDDILDIEGSQEELGKDIGSDQEKKKATYPSIFGLERAKEDAYTLIKEARDVIEPYGSKAEMFLLLADFVLNRKY